MLLVRTSLSPLAAIPLIALAFPSAALGAEEGKDEVEWSGYGTINYFQRDWETYPEIGDGLDLERFVLGFEKGLAPGIEMEAELEFEHGGTGAAMEYERFEEFGEFEQEIEAGGEVLVEELYLTFETGTPVDVKAGHMVVPVGLANAHHDPQDYFTVTRHEAEVALLPSTWHETGLAAEGTFGDLTLEAQVVSGLDSSGFSSLNWVQPGHQMRFEEARADSPALVLAGEYRFTDRTFLGGSYYRGNTTENRPRPDLDEDAVVTITELHGVFREGPWTVRAGWLRGDLSSADAVTRANKNLSNNLNIRKTAVGSAAEARFVEAGLDVLPGEKRLDLFARLDDYDTMAETEGDIQDNGRAERETTTVGLNWLPARDVVLKAQYSQRELGLAEDNREDTLALGLGFTF